MPINSNPDHARVTHDVRNYRDLYEPAPGEDDFGRREIRTTLIGPDSNANRGRGRQAADDDKYGRGPDDKNPYDESNIDGVGSAAQVDENIKKIQGFYDYAAWDGQVEDLRLQRLGGRLPGSADRSPAHENEPVPEDKWPEPGKAGLTWGDPFDRDASDNPIQKSVTIQADGAIIHTLNGAEIPHVHEYMHAIFNDILFATRDLLEEINVKLEAYIDSNMADPLEYMNAVSAFHTHLADLNYHGNQRDDSGGNKIMQRYFATALNAVTIEPVTTNEGFIVTCRFELMWKNPYHSSSTIRVP